jgi:hypothetical protein
MKKTSPAAWKAMSAVVYFLWIVAVTLLVITLIYRGEHPDSLHGAVTAGMMLLLFCPLPTAIIHSITVRRALDFREEVPKHVLATRSAAWWLVIACLALGYIVVDYAKRRV